MTTITKERIELFVKSPLENGLTRGEQMELARIALASLEAEKGADPVVFTDERNLRHIARGRETSLIWGKQNQEVGDIPLYRHAQPAPVVPEKLPCSVELKPGLIIGKGCKTETLLTALRRRADYYAKIDAFTPEERAEHEASIEAFKAMLPTPADSQGRPRAPVVPPAIEPDYKVIKSILPTTNPDEYACCIAADMWNACRADMFQGSQPVSNRDELPYAQVKAVADLYALCWQSGEVVTYTPDPEKATIWLNNYSGTCAQEYVKLERLQEALAGNSPVIPEDLRRAFEAVARLNNEMYCWTSCMSYNGSYNGEPEGLLKRNIREIEHIMDSCRAAMLQDNQRDLSQPVDPQVAKYEQIMLQAGNSPVSPDGWISCSERMPVIGELNWRTSFPLLITCEIGVIPAYYGFVSVNGDRHYGFMESLKYGDDSGNHPQTNEYGLISNVTHWMPLPEPPQEVK